MKKNSPLYDALKQWMGQACAWSHLSHLKTCLWMVVALCQTGSVSFTKWTVCMPCRGLFAQSKQRRISLWLHNARINVHRLYAPLIQAALADWQEEVTYLALDTSLFWDEYCLVRLCVVHRGRALPVCWRVFKHHSASLAFSDYREMLLQAAKRLPKGVKVVLLADRGFVHTKSALSRLCFLLAIATLYVTAQGVELVESGKRRWIDTHWFRGNSYFRLGWDWIKAATLHGWSLIQQVCFISNRDPEPAMASRTQHEHRLYRLEFTIQTC